MKNPLSTADLLERNCIGVCEEGRRSIDAFARVLRGRGDRSVGLKGDVVEPSFVWERHFIERLETDVEVQEGRRVVVEMPEREIRKILLGDEGNARIRLLVPPADLR